MEVAALIAVVTAVLITTALGSAGWYTFSKH